MGQRPGELYLMEQMVAEIPGAWGGFPAIGRVLPKSRCKAVSRWGRVKTNSPAVELPGVTAGYDDQPVLRSIDFVVPRGHLVGVVGPNGIGKTTLFRVILGLLPIRSGRVQVLGRELVDRATRRWVRLQTGYLAQQNDPGQMPITVLDAVLLGLWGSFQYRYWPGPKDRERAWQYWRP